MTCQISYCDLWIHGKAPFCSSHRARWRTQGHPDTEQFVRDVAVPVHEQIDLRGLGRHLRLEMQYVRQSRRDEGEIKTRPGLVQQVVNFLADAELMSLLDRPEHTWRQRFS